MTNNYVFVAVVVLTFSILYNQYKINEKFKILFPPKSEALTELSAEGLAIHLKNVADKSSNLPQDLNVIEALIDDISKDPSADKLKNLEGLLHSLGETLTDLNKHIKEASETINSFDPPDVGDIQPGEKGDTEKLKHYEASGDATSQFKAASASMDAVVKEFNDLVAHQKIDGNKKDSSKISNQVEDVQKELTDLTQDVVQLREKIEEKASLISSNCNPEFKRDNDEALKAAKVVLKETEVLKSSLSEYEETSTCSTKELEGNDKTDKKCKRGVDYNQRETQKLGEAGESLLELTRLFSTLEKEVKDTFKYDTYSDAQICRNHKQ